MPSLWLLGRAVVLWLPVRELTVGRLVVPVRPCVPTVGRVEVLGLVVLAVAEPVLPAVVPLMLPVVGRLVVVVPLIEPFVLRLPTVAPFEFLPPSLGRR